MLLWILFGMIITLDIAVYGLYRMVKERPTFKKVMDVDVNNGVYFQGLIDNLKSELEGLKKGDIFLLSELAKIREILERKIPKKDMKEKQKRGRPIKSGPRKQDIS